MWSEQGLWVRRRRWEGGARTSAVAACLKMRVMDALDSCGSQIMLKCHSRRGDTALRPPPGGAMAPTNATSLMLLKNSLSVS